MKCHINFVETRMFFFLSKGRRVFCFVTNEKKRRFICFIDNSFFLYNFVKQLPRERNQENIKFLIT